MKKTSNATNEAKDMPDPNIKQISHPESQLDAEIEKAHPLIRSLITEYRKEIVKLQNLIAKNKVSHESETAKVRAEHAIEMQKIVNLPRFEIGFLKKNDHKPSD